MDARSAAPYRVVHVMVAVIAALTGLAVAEDPSPAEPTFRPGELSIGEPIALPFGSGSASPSSRRAGPPPGDDPRAAQPPPEAGAMVPGSGWIGLAVAESTVPGRWRVEEVAANGPAARAGIAVGDELRAVNGVSLGGADDVAQTLTTIAAEQDVRVAVARDDQVTELVLRAEPRPAPRAVEPQKVAAVPPQPTAAGAESTAAPAGSAPPAATVVVPATVTPADGDASRPQWQGVPERVPEVATGSRFAPQPALEAAPQPATGPLATPTAPASAGAANASTPLAIAAGPGRTALGVRTVPIDPATQTRFHLPEPSGAYVIGVVHDLPAARAGVPPGSVIVSLGGQPVRSPVELTRIVTSGPVDKPVTVQFVLPGGESKRADVVLQALDAPLERALTGDGLTVTPAPVFEAAPTIRRAERPVIDGGVIRSEIRLLRDRLERLERLLDGAAER